jgi:hypothetical protein
MIKKQAQPFLIGKALLWGMAIVQAIRYGRAFAIAEIGRTALTGMAGLDTILAYASLGAGLVMGAGMSLGIAFVASHLRSLKGKKETQWTTALFIGMLLVSPLVLAPVIKGTMAEWLSDLLKFPLLQWVWATGVVVLPDVLIAAIGFMDRSATLSDKPATVSDAPATASDAGSDAQRPSATLKRRSAKKPATLSDADSENAAKNYACECGYTTQNRYEFSGHARTCATHKAIKAGAIPVQMPKVEVPK